MTYTLLQQLSLILIFCSFCPILSSDCDWIDIPQLDYKTVTELEIENLQESVNAYHAINKDKKESLGQRIAYLQTIEDILTKQQNSTCGLFAKMAQNKKNYLIALSQMPSDTTIWHYHQDYNDCDEGLKPLFLRNNSTYSIKMKEFWGAFWLESIDPCHRRLANYYAFWQQQLPQSPDYLSFFLWLETQAIPKYVPVVHYLSENELETHKITYSDGFLFDANKKPLNTVPEKRNLYIIDLQKNLYVITQRDGIWHTSLSQGKPVLGAGLLQVVDGVIKTINFESGHYLPSFEQSLQSIIILQEIGAKMQDPIEVIYFENRNKYRSRVPLKQICDKQTYTVQRELLSTNEF